MNLSYWERETWFSEVDYTIVGSGIVGLTCALRLREMFPKAKILILERGQLPNGASTKNAGFACFGSVSEILSDLKNHSEEEVVALIGQRVNGLSRLRNLLGDATIDYNEKGGYELFTQQDEESYQRCIAAIPRLNHLLKPLFEREVYSLRENSFGFGQVQPQLIFNAFEGQLDTGKMMQTLIVKAQQQEIKILNAITVQNFEDEGHHVTVRIAGFTFTTKELLIATNGFASKLGISGVQPARAQVLVTHPIPNLPIQGTFHLDQGYYYFRNSNNRILLGGGRNLDFKAEETTTMGQTDIVQKELERLLKTVIIPDHSFTIDHRWSGIMGVGTQKKPIIKQLSPRVYCGVRLGGMGVAIGSTVGTHLAEQVSRND